MEALLARADLAAQSVVVMVLLYLAPVAITVAAIASWRQSVPGAALIAASGTAFCLWLLLPLHFVLPEAQQLSQFATMLGWLWLVAGWGKHVLTEWPMPIWGHWIAGTVLLALPVAALVSGLTP